RPLASYAAPHRSLAASAYCLSSLSPAPHGRRHLRQEPDAGNPPVRIRGGGREQSRSLLRLGCIGPTLSSFCRSCCNHERPTQASRYAATPVFSTITIKRKPFFIQIT